MSEKTASALHPGFGYAAFILSFFVLPAVALAAFSFPPNEEGLNALLLPLALVAIAGLSVSFAMTSGLFRFADQEWHMDVTQLICAAKSEVLIVTNQNGKVIYANDAYLRLTGASHREGLRNIEQFFSGSPEISAPLYRLAQAVRLGKTAIEEVRLAPQLDHQGHAVCYKIKAVPLQSGIGRLNLWSVEDVTGEREKQESVFRERQQVVDFLDHASFGFFSSQANGKVSYMNATLANWLGYPSYEAVSASLKLADFIVESSRPHFASLAGKAGETLNREFDIEFKDCRGQILPAHVLHHVTIEQDGVPGSSHVLVLSQRLNDRPAENVADAQSHFSGVFNATPMAIAIADKTGRITCSNTAFARLMPLSLKADIQAGIAADDHALVNAALAAAFQGRTGIPPTDVKLAGDGNRSARLFVSAADEMSGRGATIYALDTSEQRALQNSLAQSQKMQAIGQLAGGVAHDFNNVLTAIIGYSDLLLANHRPTDPSFQDINQIKQNANRAASLVRQLLAFSRRQTLRPQVLQLGDVLSDLQMLLRRLVGEKIDLELRHGRDLWLVEADVHQFEHVLVNLVVNARDAMPAGGRIILRTRNIETAECANFNEASLISGDYVAIEVEDFGHGIPPEIRNKIFEPFFTTKEVGKGTGLGLAMVYGIIKQTGGYVFCSSTIGKGTVFTILLPRYIAQAGQATRPADQASQMPADLTGRGTILLVEDEEAVRAFGARALASRGYTVLQAGSGLDALQVAEQNKSQIDLIVSDVVMPEMDGPTMLGELRKRGVKAKVIFVSGYAEDAFAKNLPEGEDFGFLPKPFSLKQLIEAVKGRQ